jgi:plasmid stabilization system protein ParE
VEGDPGRATRAVSREVRVADDARRQLGAVRDWWREHRPAAPELFEQEVASLFALLAESPEIGPAVPVRGARGVRRALLPMTRHHVYYQVRRDSVLVVAVWSAVRGRGPRLAR